MPGTPRGLDGMEADRRRGHLKRARAARDAATGSHRRLLWCIKHRSYKKKIYVSFLNFTDTSMVRMEICMCRYATAATRVGEGGGCSLLSLSYEWYRDVFL